jgi:hypothetical protein
MMAINEALRRGSSNDLRVSRFPDATKKDFAKTDCFISAVLGML